MPAPPKKDAGSSVFAHHSGATSQDPVEPPASFSFESSLGNLARQLGSAPGSQERAVRVLVVSAAEEEHRFLRHLFAHTNWRIYSARGCTEATAVLDSQPIPVILCDYELPDGDWRRLLATVSRSEPPSLLIVTSRAADDFLWAEVLNLGGYDVLMKPYDPVEVIRVVSLAWLHWKNLRERAMHAAEASGTRVAGGA